MDEMLKMSRSGVWDFGWEVCGLKKLVRCHVLSLLDAALSKLASFPQTGALNPKPQMLNPEPSSLGLNDPRLWS